MSGRPGRHGSKRPAKNARQPPSGWEARRAAADLVLKIMDERMAMEDALAASTPFDALEGSDRGFARAIAGATLRALGRIDRSLSQ
ncbi:MAG: Fmu (Sun) domain-containing protein, partial [Pseudomonadota bacterium]